MAIVQLPYCPKEMLMIYLDNGSTTKIDSQVLQVLTENLQNNYYNPSSIHGGGLTVLELLKQAKKTMIEALSWQGDFLFTSGGTEANNLAILGTVKPKTHIITTKSEHPSVLRTIDSLKTKGITVSYIGFLENGQINIEDLSKQLSENPQTSLVSIMNTNNETGNRQDTKKIGQVIKNNCDALYHTDCVAAFGKHALNTENVDMLTVSSHKIHGPGGVGGLYVKRGINLRPQFFGGHQQNGKRPGTEFSTGQIAFAKATQIANENLEKNKEHVSQLWDKFKNLVLLHTPDAVINTSDFHSPYVLNISFPKTKGQVVVNALSDRSVYCSAGAACNERSTNQLKELGYPKEIYETAIRFSFSRYNTIEEIEIASEKLKEVLKLLRR